MATIRDVIGDFTPLSNNVVKKLNIIRGALACKIFYTSNLNDRVCRMGLRHIADELGIDHSTASKNIEWLVTSGYIDRVKEHTPLDPAHYRCTQLFYDLAKGGVDVVNRGVDVVNRGVDVVNRGVDVVNRGVDVVYRGVDVVNKEEDLKEDLKEKTTTNGSDFLDSDFAKVCIAYENEIGFISPTIADTLKDLLRDYPPAWLLEAFKIAVEANARKLSYVKGILTRWKTNGKDAPRQTPGPASQPTNLTQSQLAVYQRLLAEEQARQ
jgi:DnaD/phage-associated family protein